MRLEEYPSLPQGDNPSGRLFAMRFLEMLTPIRHLMDDDYVQIPQEGKLVCRKRPNGKFAPWGFNPSHNRQLYVDWIARSRVWTGDSAL